MWEPTNSSSVPVHHLSHFWHPWVDPTLQHSLNIEEENLGSGLAVGAVTESWLSLKLPSLVVPGGKWLPFYQVGGIPTSEREPLLVAYKWSPKQHDKDTANTNQVVSFISCQGLCTQIEWLNPVFQFTATNFVSMAAKSSDLVDNMSGANLQMEGHMDMPSLSAKDLQESEALGSSPSHLPSWSPARRPLSSCPDTKHCLEIWGDINRRIRGGAPILSFLDGTSHGRYAAWH